MTIPSSNKSEATGRSLKGPEKVAALLLTMGKPMASRLLKHFDVDELKLVTRSVTELGSVPVQILEVLVEEFASQFINGVDLQGSAAEGQELLSGLLSPEQVSDIMADVTGNGHHAIWERLSTISESFFAEYLVKEHPQSIAFILSKVVPAFAAKVMGQMPRDLRNEVMRRMVSIATVAEPMIRIIQTQLAEDFLSNFSRQTGNDHNARMADIINKMEKEQMEDVLQSLSVVRPKDAEVLRGLMFTFDDIVKLPKNSRSTLFDKIPTELVVLALKGTDATFRDLILSSLAARARRIVDSELTNGGPAEKRDVLKARRTIADTALQLAEAGDIELNSPEDEDELY